MSHNIGKYDRQEGTEMAWHRLTNIKENIEADDNFLTEWDVEKRHMFNPDGTVSEYCRITCTDQPLFIGDPVHKDTYGLITNKDFLEIVNECLLSVSGAKIRSIGSINDRGRIFASVSIPDLPEFKGAGREFRAYLNFLNSYDKSSPFVVNASNICVVCNNTFTCELLDTNNKVFRATIRHTKNALSRLEDIDQMIDAYVGTQQRFKCLMDNFETKPVAVFEARRFFVGFSSDKIEKPSTRLLNKADRLTGLFVNGRGNRGETMADAFSAITDYYTHESSGGDNVGRQIASSEFGFGADMKRKALDVMSDQDKFEDVVEKGYKILQLAN